MMNRHKYSEFSKSSENLLKQISRDEDKVLDYTTKIDDLRDRIKELEGKLNDCNASIKSKKDEFNILVTNLKF